MVGEQSSGPFVAMPGETDALCERFGAKVVRITPLETGDVPSLPGSRLPA
jgi:ribulose-bisphosphate carboxylase large chain